MKYRALGRTGWRVSEVSFGAWAIGGDWGDVDDKASLAALERAIDLGVNFIDTADVYGDGRYRAVRGVSELFGHWLAAARAELGKYSRRERGTVLA